MPEANLVFLNFISLKSLKNFKIEKKRRRVFLKKRGIRVLAVMSEIVTPRL